MVLELLFFIFLGILTGLITGLVPGLHPNNIFILLISLPFLLTIHEYFAIAFVVSLSISNTFTSFIPSLFLGAPESESVFSVLPGHRYLLMGRGFEALTLTVIGGIGVIIMTVVTFPILLIILPLIYSLIHPHLHIILLTILLWMCATERGREKILSVFVIILSGFFGIISLNSLPSQLVLFPALAGLFGISQLMISLFNRTGIPPQGEYFRIVADRSLLKGIVVGWLAGMLAGILPGVGSAQAGIISAQAFRARLREFLTAIGGINTANILFTFIVFFTIGKTRSGAVWASSQILKTVTHNEIVFITAVALLSCFLSAILTTKMGKFFVKGIMRMNYTKITISVITFIAAATIFLSGFLGLLILFIGTCIGTLSIVIGVRRAELMAFLILPTILYFSGLSTFIFTIIGL